MMIKTYTPPCMEIIDINGDELLDKIISGSQPDGSGNGDGEDDFAKPGSSLIFKHKWLEEEEDDDEMQQQDISL